MFSMPVSAQLGTVQIATTSERGFTPDELAEQALRKIVYVGDQAPMALREQAQAFKGKIYAVLLHYLVEMRRNERITVIAALERAGEHAAAELVRKL